MSENTIRSTAEIKADIAAAEANLKAEKSRLDRELLEAEIASLEARFAGVLDDREGGENHPAVDEYRGALARAEMSYLKAQKKALQRLAEAVDSERAE